MERYISGTRGVRSHMTQPVIRTETLRYWLDQLESQFRPNIVQSGYEYAATGMVTTVHVEGGALRAYVQGSSGHLYSVQLDFDFFGISTCSCPYEGYCKHMVAAIFRACTLAGLNLHAVAEEVLNPRDPLRRAAMREVAAGKEGRLKQVLAEHEAQKRARGQLSSEDGSEAWKTWLEQRMTARSTGGTELAHLRQTLTGAAVQLTRDWPEQPGRLFRLYIELALMQAADQLARKFDVLYNVSYNGPSIENIVQMGMREIDTLVAGLDVETLLDSHSEHIELVRGQLGNHPFDLSSSNIDWLYLYRLLWWRVLKSPVWMREEEGRIQEMLGNDRMIAQKRELLRCAQAHFQLRRGEDAPVLEKIDTLQLYRAPEWWLFYLERFQQEGAWSRLVQWLRWMLPQIRTSAGREQMSTYMKLWKQTAAHIDCEEEWQDTLLRLLPASYNHYEDYLFTKKDYRGWTDIMMSLGLTASQVHAERLAQVESAEPRAVLPLLHQAVEHHIARKNREDYRLAVKMLKQLEQAYRRMERTDAWQEFMRQLHHRYSRLRSFQEELKKGGLRPS